MPLMQVIAAGAVCSLSEGSQLCVMRKQFHLEVSNRDNFMKAILAYLSIVMSFHLRQRPRPFMEPRKSPVTLAHKGLLVPYDFLKKLHLQTGGGLYCYAR